MRQSSSPHGFHTSSFIVRKRVFDTHLCSHLQWRAISLPGNGPGITVRKRRHGDARHRSFFTQECECMWTWFPSMAIPRWLIHFYVMLHYKWTHQQPLVWDRTVICRGYVSITQHAHFLSTGESRILHRNFMLTLIKTIHLPLQRFFCTRIPETEWIKGTAGQLWNCSHRGDEENDSTVWKIAPG